MGWILTSKKKKAQEEQASQAAAEADVPVAAAKQVHWDTQSTLWKVRVGVSAVGAVALGFGWVWMTNALETYAAARLDKDDTPVAMVELANTPGWMDVKLREQLQGVAGQKISNDPMAGKELAAAYLAFSNNPWVDSVNSVRRTASGGIVIEANYREPVAMVEQPTGLRLVDAKGVMLPWEYKHEQQAAVGLPVIKGVKGAQPEADGELWNSPDLLAGLGMVKTMQGQPFFNHVVAYDVGRRDSMGRVRVSLVTTQGMIDWGLPVGQEQAIEPGVDHKLKLVSGLFKPGQASANGQQMPMINLIGNRVANVYGESLTFAPMTAGSREDSRIEYTRGR